MTINLDTAPRSWLIVVLLMLLTATGVSCLDWGVEEPEGDADGDGDGDADFDGDTDLDGDLDADADADGDRDTDLDLDFEREDDSDIDHARDADDPSDAEADEEADSDHDIEADSDVDVDEDVALPLDPVVGDAIMLYEGFVSAHFGQAAVASFAPGCYFVTWSNFASDDGTEADVLGHRVCVSHGSATILDPSPIEVTSTAESESLQSVACAGSVCLVVFQSSREPEAEGDIWSARVQIDAGSISVLDPEGLPISRASGTQLNPQVTFDGDHFVAVWWDSRSGSSRDIYGARVTTGGVVLDADETRGAFRVSTPPPSAVYPDVECASSRCLVAWGSYEADAEARNIVGAFLHTSGAGVEVLPTVAISTAVHAQNFGSLAADGTDFLAVWYDARDPLTEIDIYASRIRASDGSILDDPVEGIAVGMEVIRDYL